MIPEKNLEEIMCGKPSILYHYTKVENFCSIMQSRELWYSDLSTMDDELELVDFVNKLNNALEKDISLECQQKRISFFERMSNKLSYPFVFCLSTAKDNAS